jgi:hypothetical protein
MPVGRHGLFRFGAFIAHAYNAGSFSAFRDSRLFVTLKGGMAPVHSSGICAMSGIRVSLVTGLPSNCRANG